MQEKIDKYNHLGFEIDPDWEENGYVYLLTDYKGKVIYVGQTMNYVSRINQHISKREIRYAYAYVKKLDSRYLLIQETILINKFKPIYNKMGFIPARIDHRTAYKNIKSLTRNYYFDSELYIRLNKEILGSYHRNDYISYEEMIKISIEVIKNEDGCFPVELVY